MAALFISSPLARTAGLSPIAENFQRDVAPFLKKHCYDCHADGVRKGRVSFDDFDSEKELFAEKKMWLAALKNVRAGIMPPHEEGVPRPEPSEIENFARWIKRDAFGLDPVNSDPGRVTLRRLNRVEYRNTIRDLMGIDFNSEVEFPPDDSGHGFDNNSDVLTLSPLLLEKYLAAAETIVERAVPQVPKVMREQVATGREFRGAGANGDQLSAKRAAVVSRTFKIDQADRYQVALELELRGSFDFDPARARVTGRIDGEERFTETIAWSERRTLRHEFTLQWAPGDHVVTIEVEPLALAAATAAVTDAADASASSTFGRPRGTAEPPPATATNVNLRISSVVVRGPMSPQHWKPPANHARFFPQGEAPADPAGRAQYASEILRRFATRAFRRPIEEPRLGRLVEIARQVYERPGGTFEAGIARAMMAVLASPRFIFFHEASVTHASSAAIADLDDYSLASRLSYFLWSTMPDAELFQLAERGELRRKLRAQLARMLADPRAQAFIRNFTGQWLQARDVEFVPINARVVLGPHAPRNRDGRIEFDSALRKLMRSETEAYFEHLIRSDGSLLELIDSDYTFLNERLAAHYGVPGVMGEQLRRVKLPAGSPRGGVLTQGTVLTVTSNPTRTSPVKRGMFILENFLGTPPPPAPPNVPELEEARSQFEGREPKLSEILAAHRANVLCHSCHARMDPLGLALENFNAMGVWREQEAGQPIEPAGKLVTGETFADVRELKRVIARDRKADVYRCLTEKLLMYALGRGLEYYDVETVDQIVARLEREGGRISALLQGVVESAPFQKQRVERAAAATSSLSLVDRPRTQEPTP